MLYKVWWMDSGQLWHREAFIDLIEANIFAQLLIDNKFTNVFMTVS